MNSLQELHRKAASTESNYKTIQTQKLQIQKNTYNTVEYNKFSTSIYDLHSKPILSLLYYFTQWDQSWRSLGRSYCTKAVETNLHILQSNEVHPIKNKKF